MGQHEEQEEQRSDPEVLATYLLGDEYWGAGLVSRVRERVSEVAGGSGGPSSRSGSIMGLGSLRHEMASDLGDVEMVFDLAVALVEWLGGITVGSSAIETRYQLQAYLRKNKITDVAYLLGSEDLDEEASDGLLRRVVTEARGILRKEPMLPADVDRLKELWIYLTGFMGGCVHAFEEIPSDGAGVAVHACECGAKYAQYLGQKRWIAV